MCVLFNIAALQSAVAATQSIENDDSLKLAAKLLQVSHYCFLVNSCSFFKTTDIEYNVSCNNKKRHTLLSVTSLFWEIYGSLCNLVCVNKVFYAISSKYALFILTFREY